MSASKSGNVKGKNEASKPVEKLKFFKNFLNSITIEPFVICWMIPFVFTSAAMQNLNYEKVCREYAVDQNINKEICKLFIQKSNFELKCIKNENVTSIDWNKISEELPEIRKITERIESDVIGFLCNAEDYVQTRISHIDSIRKSLSAIGPLVVLWFAGPWSDRKKLRLPCMLVPYLGEAIGYVIVFISAVYVDSPVELPAYGYRFIPAFTGAGNLLNMAAYSYLTSITTEENRTFRFGAFSAILSVIPFIGNLAAPTLMKSFSYAQLFGMMVPVHILGLVYFLRLEEPEEKFVDNGHDNLGMDDQIKAESLKEKSITSTEELDRVERDSKNYILEFFDLAYAVQCISVVMKKRENVLKSLLIFLLASYYFSYSVTLCEDGVSFFFQRKVLNWDVDTYVYNFAYRIFCGTVGTIIMTEVFGKYLKVPDIFLALISIVLSIVSKFVYYSSDTTLKFFIGSTIDAAEAVRNLVIRSIVTQVITADETSTIFSLMGILEAVGQFIFGFIYPKVYQYLLPIDNVKLIFMFSASLLTLVLILLCAIYKLLKIKKAAEKKLESTKL